jgi:hypothetical protein
MISTESAGKTCEKDEKGNPQGLDIFACCLWRGGCTTFHQLNSRFHPGGSFALECETVPASCDGNQPNSLYLRIAASVCEAASTSMSGCEAHPDGNSIGRSLRGFGRSGQERDGSFGRFGVMAGSDQSRTAGTLHRQQPLRAGGCKLCEYAMNEVYEEPF